MSSGSYEKVPEDFIRPHWWQCAIICLATQAPEDHFHPPSVARGCSGLC